MADINHLHMCDGKLVEYGRLVAEIPEKSVNSLLGERAKCFPEQATGSCGYCYTYCRTPINRGVDHNN